METIPRKKIRLVRASTFSSQEYTFRIQPGRAGFPFLSVILRYYSCHNCGNLVSRHEDIVSKNFQGGHGRAFLFSHTENIVEGPKEDGILITGLHTVLDVFCDDCGENLGWKYVYAYHDSEKYKEGKFVFERLMIVKADDW